MVEKTIPWWRKALEFALGGLRSGFGFFSRPARPESVPAPMISSSIQESPEEDRALTEPSPNTEFAADTPVVPAEAVVKLPSKPEPVAVAEEAPLAEAAPDPATAIDLTAAGNPIPDLGEETTGELGISGESGGILFSGAKAPVDPAAHMYGLKPVPFKETSISADVQAQPESEVEAALLQETGSEVVVEPEPVPVLVAEGAIDADSKLSAAETAEANTVSEAVEEPREDAEPIEEAVVVNEAVQELIEAIEPELEAEPVDESAAANTPEAVVETVEEPVKEPEAVIEVEPEPAVETATAPAIEPVAPAAEPQPGAMPEPVSEPTANPVSAAIAGPQRALKPQPSAEEKEAARKAARQKKLDEGSEESPFSVIVGQVYDGPLDLQIGRASCRERV